MRKPVVVSACEEFAMKVFPVVAEIVCLTVAPLIIVGYWFDYAIKDFKKRDGKLFDITP
jgi:hypothetical protein